MYIVRDFLFSRARFPRTIFIHFPWPFIAYSRRRRMKSHAPRPPMSVTWFTFHADYIYIQSKIYMFKDTNIILCIIASRKFITLIYRNHCKEFFVSQVENVLTSRCCLSLQIATWTRNNSDVYSKLQQQQKSYNLAIYLKLCIIKFLGLNIICHFRLETNWHFR